MRHTKLPFVAYAKNKYGKERIVCESSRPIDIGELRKFLAMRSEEFNEGSRIRTEYLP